MERMRRRQEHGLDARVGDHLGQFGAELETVAGREIASELRLLAHAADEAQPLALALRSFDDRLAPAPEANNCGIDHGCDVRPMGWLLRMTLATTSAPDNRR